MISIKNNTELDIMREAGRLLACVMNELSELVKPGISTLELDKVAENSIIRKGALPSCKGYNGYPASICASVNDEVVHGIPSKRRLQEGDILSLDICLLYKGYQSDMARTYPVGTISEDAAKLIAVTEQCFAQGFAAAIEGNRIGDIGHAVQSYAEARGYSVVRDLCGHGIGREMHEEPEVPNFGRPGHGARLMPGMVIAIEPMINVGRFSVYEDSSGWTVHTRDASLSAHYENTVAVLQNGPEILTVCR